MLIDPVPGEVTPVAADRMIIRGASIWSSRRDHDRVVAAVRREGAKRSKGWDHLGLRLSLSLPCNVGRSVVE